MALVIIVVLVLVTHTKDIRKQSWTAGLSSREEQAGFDLAFYRRRLKMVVRTKVRVWRFQIRPFTYIRSFDFSDLGLCS